jgi:hypothetical protein
MSGDLVLATIVVFFFLWLLSRLPGTKEHELAKKINAFLRVVSRKEEEEVYLPDDLVKEGMTGGHLWPTLEKVKGWNSRVTFSSEGEKIRVTF